MVGVEKERERERQRDREKEKQRESLTESFCLSPSAVWEKELW